VSGAIVSNTLTFKLSPAIYSNDRDKMIAASSLNFKFYCQLVSNVTPSDYFLNSSIPNMDLRTAQINNETSANGCFNDTSSLFSVAFY
jgi:hypothetical protein